MLYFSKLKETQDMTKKIRTAVLAIVLSIFAAVSFCFVGNTLTSNGQRYTASAEVQVDQKVTELVNMVLAFPEAYDNGELTQAIADFEAAYNDVNVTDTQRNAVDATAVTGSTYYDNISDMYHYYDAADTQSTQAANVVIDLITNLGTVTIARDFYLKLIAAENAYAALSEQTKKYVTNYADLVAARNAFNEKMGVVKDWKTAVENIVLPVTVANWDLVDAADDEWDELSQDVKDVVLLETATYGDLVAKHEDAQDQRQAIIDALANVNNLIAAIPDAIPAVGNTVDRDAYKQAVIDAKAAYEALDTVAAGTKDYFDATYPQAKEKLVLAIDRLEVIDVEDLIAAIPVDVTLEAACLQAIETARTAYDALSDTQKADVQNYNVLEAAEAIRNDKIAKVTQWKEDVAATRNGLADADLWSVDLNEYDETVADTLAYRYAQFTQDEKEYTVTVDGKTDFDAIKAVSDARIADLNDRIANLPAPITMNDRDYVVQIHVDYNKLHETQQELVNYAAFLPAYNKVMFATYFDKAVLEIDAQRDANKYTLSDKIMLNALKSILMSATPELQGIISTADLLEELVVAYADIDVLDLVEVKEELEGKIESLDQVINDKIDTAIANLTNGAIKDLQDAMDKAEFDIGKLQADLSELSNKVDNVVTSLKDYADQKDAQLKAELEEKIADLQAQIDKLQSKTTTTIIIFAILVAACAGAIVFLFVKKN